MRNPEETAGKLIDRAGICHIGSVDGEGFPNIRAMLAPRQREGIRYIYFTTNTSSRKVRQFRDDARACLYFTDRRFYRGVMLLGFMEVLEDVSAKERIWRDGDTMYYPLGVADPDYCVLKFTAETGRFYSNFKSENFSVTPVPDAL